MNAIELISESLASQGATFFLGDKSLGRAIRSYELCENPGEDPHVLYVIQAKEPLDFMPQSVPINLLIVSGQPLPSPESIGAGNNVIVLPDGVDSLSVLNRVSMLISASVRFELYSGSLLDSLVSNSSLGETLDIVSEIMGNPIALLDTSCMEFISQESTPATGDRVWDELVNEHRKIDSVLSDWEYSPTDSYWRAFKEPLIVDVGFAMRRLQAGIWRRGSCRFVLLALELTHTFNESDLALIRAITGVLSLALETPPRNKQDRVSDFIIGLIRGEISDALAIARADELRITVSNGYRLHCLMMRGQSINYIQLHSLSGMLKKALPHNVIVQHGNSILVIGDNHNRIRTEMKKAINSNGMTDFHLCTSLPMRSLHDLRHAYGQCEAINHFWGRDRDEREEPSYPSVAIRHFINDHSAWRDPLAYADPAMADMISYDRRNGTSYARTVFLYLQGFLDRSYVSERLHVHVNTVTHRLKKAEDMFGINLGDVHCMNHMRFSYELLTNQDER